MRNLTYVFRKTPGRTLNVRNLGNGRDQIDGVCKWERGDFRSSTGLVFVCMANVGLKSGMLWKHQAYWIRGFEHFVFRLIFSVEFE